MGQNSLKIFLLAIYVQIVGQKPWHKYAQIVGQKSLKIFWNNIVNFFGRHLWLYSGTKISENFPGTKFLYVQIVGQKSLAQIRPDSGTKVPESFLAQNCQFFRVPSLAESAEQLSNFRNALKTENKFKFSVLKKVLSCSSHLVNPFLENHFWNHVCPENGTEVPERCPATTRPFLGCHLWPYPPRQWDSRSLKIVLKPNVHSWGAIFPNIRPDCRTEMPDNFF